MANLWSTIARTTWYRRIRGANVSLMVLGIGGPALGGEQFVEKLISAEKNDH